ncbi:hypothetical protein B7463_g12253, partial [Scytalidium lignicola]
MAVTIPENVPGTVHLVDLDHNMSTAHLGETGDIVLVPSPSADPEDPLNWNPGRKRLAVWSAYVYIWGVGLATANQYSILTPLSQETGITLTQLNLGTGLMFLFLGWSCLIWQPLALVYGRRGVYILSAILSMIPCIWSVYSKSAGEWYAHRILLGIFASPSESLPEVTIPDLFFAHNRGFYMALYAFLLFGSNFFAPFCAGFINDAGGWRWVMWFGVIALACSALFCFFFMEETMYFRSTLEGLEGTAPVPGAVSLPVDEEKSPSLEKSAKAFAVSADDSSPQGSTIGMGQTFRPPKTYVQKLWPFTAHPDRPSNKQLFTMMYRPLIIIICFPCTLWSGLLYGTNLSWYNVLNGTMSLILTAAPYNFSASLVGVAYMAPLIGAAFACLWSGFYADKLAIWFAHRNGGVREAEHRLWSLLVSGFIAPVGLIVWGVGAAHQIHWIGLMFGIGMLTFSVVCGGATALSYNVDCFKDLAGETLIAVIIVRNTLGFGFSYAITPWVDNQGLIRTFVAVGMVALAATLTFLIMVYAGKRLRRFSAKRYYAYVATSVAGAH